MRDKYIILKYLRLSKEDGDKGESDSISNQRNLIDRRIGEMFKGKNTEIIELVDDGYTGTNLERPGMKKLLILAETHCVDCIIVKDFSRFARDYVEVGRYVEMKFPEWQIRFISINDDYDSSDYNGITGGIETALKSIAYAMYSADLSEKIKSSRNVFYKQGKYVAPYAFFGYRKDPDNKHRLIIDERAAAVVRRMFEMRSGGQTPIDIAKIFNREKIPTPAQYKKEQFPDCGTWDKFERRTQWTSPMIRGLLRDERYTGKYISGRNERVAVGAKSHRRKKPEDIVVIENAFEAIITEETFKSVQTTTHGGTKPKSDNGILRGLVRCGGCGHIMSAYGSSDETTKYYCPYKSYSDYNLCCKKPVLDKDITSLVIKAIQSEIKKAAPERTAVLASAINRSLIRNSVKEVKIFEDERIEIEWDFKERTDFLFFLSFT